MPSINLLPWREADRKKRQRDFMVATAGAFVSAIAVLGLTIFAYAQMIDAQNARSAQAIGQDRARPRQRRSASADEDSGLRADPGRGRDRTMLQLAFVFESDDFADFSHAVAFHDRAASHTR